MKISEYIAALQALKDEHGDLEVEIQGYERRIAETPHIANRMILSPRQTLAKFWYDGDPIKQRGEKVVRV